MEGDGNLVCKFLSPIVPTFRSTNNESVIQFPLNFGWLVAKIDLTLGLS